MLLRAAPLTAVVSSRQSRQPSQRKGRPLWLFNILADDDETGSQGVCGTGQPSSSLGCGELVGGLDIVSAIVDVSYLTLHTDSFNS